MRKKLIRYVENQGRNSILEKGKTHYDTVKGNWNADYFGNPNPVTVELACGRGEYTTGLAAAYPDRNFVGVDVKGDRLWMGSMAAENEGLANTAFLRAQIHLLENFFAPQEVAEIWIVFPDPRPRQSDAKRRLTHTRYLTMYRNLLSANGIVHLKTDSRMLFDFTLEMLQTMPVKDLRHTQNLYASDLLSAHHGIQTHYERIFTGKGFDINYLQFKFDG